jgi:hypothetical protein
MNKIGSNKDEAIYNHNKKNNDTFECPATVLAFASYHMSPGQDPVTSRLRNRRLIT